MCLFFVFTSCMAVKVCVCEHLRIQKLSAASPADCPADIQVLLPGAAMAKGGQREGKGSAMPKRWPKVHTSADDSWPTRQL